MQPHVCAYVGSRVRPIRFGECLVSLLGQRDGRDCRVDVSEQRGCCVLQALSDPSSGSPLGHAHAAIDGGTDCPAQVLAREELTQRIMWAPRFPLMKLGVCVLLERCDGGVLLTRRHETMRSFPRCWVLPGGGVDAGESLVEAGLRELKEETGLHALESEDLAVLALWESCYPTTSMDCLRPKGGRDIGEISRPPNNKRGIEVHGISGHYLVVYMHALLPALASDRVVLQETEADESRWLTPAEVHTILRPPESELWEGHASGVPALDPRLRGIYPNAVGEGIAQGHRFALQTWMGQAHTQYATGCAGVMATDARL